MGQISEPVTAGGIVCVDCGVGSYGAADKSGCVQCPEGSAQSETGKATCEACLPGYHTDKRSGQVACQPCLPGEKWIPVEGTVEGAQNDENLSNFDKEARRTLLAAAFPVNIGVCEKCPPGFFQPVSGGLACQACGMGRVSASAGAYVCVACGKGRYTLTAASMECELCEVGTFSDLDENPLPGCTKCPPAPAVG